MIYAPTGHAIRQILRTLEWLKERAKAKYEQQKMAAMNEYYLWVRAIDALAEFGLEPRAAADAARKDEPA